MGIHDTLITGSARNTIIEYDTHRNRRGGRKLQVMRELCLAHQVQSMRYKCGKIDEDRLCGSDERLHRVNVTEIGGGENRGMHAAE